MALKVDMPATFRKPSLAAAACASLCACATEPAAPLDPSRDARLGEEVERACFGSINANSGGYRQILGRDAFIVGAFRDQYALIFSGGCRDLRSGAVPVFFNRGDDCRRRGERVDTVDFGGVASGGCVIQHIYRWDGDEEGPTGD